MLVLAVLSLKPPMLKGVCSLAGCFFYDLRLKKVTRSQVVTHELRFCCESQNLRLGIRDGPLQPFLSVEAPLQSHGWVLSSV